MSSFRAGDWYCPKCNNHNFARNKICKDCATSGPVTNVAALRSGDWKCKHCDGPPNFAKRASCYTCGKSKTGEDKEDDRSEGADREPKRAKTEAVSASSVIETPEYGLSIDVEMAGPEMNRDLLAIGATFGKKDGTIIKQADFCSRVPKPEEFHPRTWNEFWVNHQEILKRIDAAAVAKPIREFDKWLRDLEKEYGPFGRKHKQKVRFSLISDNPGCDIGRINAAFMRLVDPAHPGLADMFDDYVETDDPTEQIKGMNLRQAAEANRTVTALHDHWPVNDATETFQLWCGVKRAILM